MHEMYSIPLLVPQFFLSGKDDWVEFQHIHSLKMKQNILINIASQR